MNDKYRIEISDEAVEFELKRLIHFYSKHMSPATLAEKRGEFVEMARKQAFGSAVLLMEAERLHIEITEDEIKDCIENMAANAGGEAAFEGMLKRQKISMETIRKLIADGRKVDKLVGGIVSGVGEPTDNEIRDYYDQNHDNYIRPERALAMHILIKPEGDSDDDRFAAREKLLDLRQEFRDGASFPELAAGHSQCPSGRKSGGSLGWIQRGSMIPAFDEALFSTEPGEVSDIVETPLGYHLIHVADREEPATASFEEARGAIRDLLVHDRRGTAISDYINKVTSGDT